MKEAILNYLVLVLLSVMLYKLWQYKRGWVLGGVMAACLALLGISSYDAVLIQKAVPTAIRAFEQAQTIDQKEISFTLSTKGKNVVVLMLDRAIGAYLPYLLQERPELKEQFDGFTWYPNTLSYGNSTNTGSPAVYGGYDYRPAQMNERSDVLLVDKHNEALKTMPLLFSEAGYTVTVCDPPYANYGWVPDLSIFDEYPEITAFLTESGQFMEPIITDEDRQRIWNRNFFCFGIMKSAPIFMQSFLYRDGFYYDSRVFGVEEYHTQWVEGLSVASGYREEFLETYYALCAYPQITKTRDTDQNSFVMLYNSTAHNLSLLQVPEYEPALRIDNTQYDLAHQDRFIVDGREVRIAVEKEMRSYQCNMAAMIKLGVWLDDLRAKGVYDNTRIIVVADHGGDMGSFSDMVFGENRWEDAMGFNPLLMVKDFGDTGFHTDYSFMTNADTPTLAFDGLIDNPVNPFTGRKIDSEAKQEDVHLVFHTMEVHVTNNNGTTYLPGEWLTLSSDDIFDTGSWKWEREGR